MSRKLFSLLLSLLLLPVSCVGEQSAEPAQESPALSLYAINVRKADSLLLRCGKSAYLIDTGTEDDKNLCFLYSRKYSVISTVCTICT